VQVLRETKRETVVHRLVSAIERFFDFYITTGERNDNPMCALSIHSGLHCTPKDCACALLSLKHEKDFRGYRDTAIIALTCHTYIKFTEFSQLTLKSFDTAKERITINEKNYYPLPEQAIKKVGRHVANMFLNERASIDAPMFASKAGVPLTRQGICKVITNNMREVGKSIDANCNPRYLRGSMVQHK